MVAMSIRSNHFAGDFSVRYESKDFYQRIWPIFLRGEVLAFVGCLGLSATLSLKMAIKAGLRAAGASFVLFIMLNLLGFASFHDMTEASAFTFCQAVFSCGCGMAIIGSSRLAWSKIRSRSA